MLFRDKKTKKYIDVNFFDFISTSDFYNKIMKTKFNHIPESKNITSKTNNEIINDIKGTLKKFT